MPLVQVRAWRGIVRARLKDTISDLHALLAFNAKHPTYEFLDAGTVSSINAILSTFENLLLAKRLR